MACVEAGAGGEAIERGAAGVEFHGDVGDGHVGFLLDFGHGVEGGEGFFAPGLDVEHFTGGGNFGPHSKRHAGEIFEIQAAFARAPR